MKEQFKTSKDHFKLTLRDITNEKMHLKRQCDMSKCKVGRLKDQHALLEEEFVQLQLDLVSDKEDLDGKIVVQILIFCLHVRLEQGTHLKLGSCIIHC